MSQDILADTLNQIMNAKRAGLSQITVKKHSKFLSSVLTLARLKGYIEDFKVSGTTMTIVLGEKLNSCLAIKPRYLVKSVDVQKYVRRYLPARDLGVLIVSTSKGLMTHHVALEKNIGGSLIAYFY
jgi:small subunit ribosomal protein S8